MKRELALWDVFALASGAMISSGLFVLPGLAFGKAGPSVILAYLLAGILYLPVMSAQVELATALPKSGGSYFFVERSLGGLLGTVAGMTNWVSLALKAAFAFLGIGTLVLLIPGLQSPLWISGVAVAACLFFATLNILSVKGTGRLQSVLVCALLVILIGYVAVGFPSIEPVQYKPFLPEGAGIPAFLSVTGMVFISYGGLTKVVDVAGEVQRPQHNLPLGMLLAFVVVNLLYVLTVFVTVGLVAPEQLSGSLTPISIGALEILGPPGGWVIGIAAFFAYATTGNAGILSASRSPMAMGHDGLMPHGLSVTGRRFGTPWVAVTATAGLIVLVVAGFSVENLVKAASAMLLLSFVMVNVSLIVFRHSGIQAYRPRFRTPLYPWLPVCASALYLGLIVSMGAVPVLIACGVTLLSAAWYFLYGQRHVQIEPAVLNMVRLMLAKHVQRLGLEDEFLEIALERDEVAIDRFDELVRDAPVLDIKEAVDADEAFGRIAPLLAKQLGMKTDDVVDLLKNREKEGSTVIEPGLAVPHIIVSGEGIFAVCLVRCREGITFPGSDEPVTTAFVLAGTPDQRQFHLQALMAVATTVQEKGFRHRWLSAPNEGQLRDVVLLSGRSRIPHENSSRQ